MRKITSLLMLLCMFVGTAWAQVTKFYKPGVRLSELTTDQRVMFYNTAFNGGEDRTGFLVDNAGSFALEKKKPSAAPIFSEKVGVWTLESITANSSNFTVKVKGTNGYVGINGKTNNSTSQNLLFHKWTESAGDKRADVKSENAAGTVIENAAISADDNVWLITNENQSNTWNGNTGSFANWSTGHPYAIYSIVEATTDDLNTYLGEAKAKAIEELTTLKKLPEIFTTAESTITKVENVTLSNDDLETALNTISELLASVKSELDGKHVKFCSQGGGNRGGRYLGYDAGNKRMAAILSDDDNVVWTLKSVGDGIFKLYNAANNHWLGGPDYDYDVVEKENADGSTSTENTNYRTPAKGNENDAVVYKFVYVAENVVCLVPNGTSNMVHVQNDANSNYRIMNHYSTTDGASLWNVTVLRDKQITHDSYTAFANSKKTLLNGFIAFAKQMQDSYGLVKRGDDIQVVVNHPIGNDPNNPSSDHQPSSNLLDGNNSTFVHSSYDGSNMNTVTYHYIQAKLSEAKRNVFFYLSKRNNDNRPSLVKVYTSTDGINFSDNPVTTMIMSESTDASVQSYFTEAIDLGGEYKHLRFEVVYTNTHTKYFTLSEFYVLPVLEDATKYVADLTSTSVFAEDAETCLIAANTYAETLKRYGFSAGGAKEQLKAQISELLEANKTNHSNAGETPQLGQYPFETYQALEAAHGTESLTATELLEEIDIFINSKNRPVFTIDGVISYANGWSIYDSAIKNAKGNTHYFKPTNVYDKSMWWALDMTTREVSAIESVGIKNLGTGNVFWDCATIKITETSENNGADGIFLFYTTDNDSPIHAQDDNDVICRYGDYTANSGSAWKFTYIGDSYDLTQLTDEYFAAATELVNISVPNFTFSTNVNQYDEATKPALDAALANRTDVLRRIASKEDIANAKTQLETAIANVKLNMPVDGRFYRLRCTASGMKYLQYTQSSNSERFDLISGEAGKTVNATFCYIDGGLVAYANPQYINHDANIANYRMTKTNVTFSEATNDLGQYFIKVGGRYLYGDGNYTDSGDTPSASAGYRWWLEDVTELPVTISAAKYATFYCPVAVTLPEDLTAYSVASTTDTYAKMGEIADVIPANTGVLLYADVEEATTYKLTIGGEASEVESKMEGTVASTYVDEDSYVLSMTQEEGIGFYKATKNITVADNGTGTKVAEGGTHFLNNGFKAYLPASVVPSAARFLSFDFGTETAIESIEGAENGANAVIYDLSGRRVQKAQKGLYIVNGVKVIK